MHSAVGLVALGVGYLVYLNASKEKKGLKLLGQVVGVIVMAGALLGVLCEAQYKMGGCPFSKALMCPFGAKAAAPSDQTK